MNFSCKEASKMIHREDIALGLIILTTFINVKPHVHIFSLAEMPFILRL